LITGGNMSKQDNYLGHRCGRRSFLQALGGAAAATLLPLSSRAESGEIHELSGDVLANGKPINKRSIIHPGDVLRTQSNGRVTFIIGQDAFFMRERSEMQIEGAPTAILINGLRLITGAIGAAFGKGGPRSITTPTATIGIRGTGVYMETRGDGVYFCTCYGDTVLTSNFDAKDREVVSTANHQPRLITRDVKDGSRFHAAPFETHTNEEMDTLEKCVGRRAPWYR
jgi:hypothetical protein